jgi:hypothetical protein
MYAKIFTVWLSEHFFVFFPQHFWSHWSEEALDGKKVRIEEVAAPAQFSQYHGALAATLHNHPHLDCSEASSEDVSSAKAQLKLSKSFIRLQLASLFGKIWEEFSPENVTKAFKVNQCNHNI